MAKLFHPDMRQSRDLPQNNTYVVDDLSDVDNRLSQFESGVVEEAPEVKERDLQKVSEVDFSMLSKKPVIDLEDATKKSLEKLIFIGRNVKTLELGGHKFEVSTLTNKENNEVLSKMIEVGEGISLFMVRVFTLANALRTVDGVELDKIPVDGEFGSSYLKRLTIVDNFQFALVEKLYGLYEEAVKEANEVIYGEAIKK
jgi:hypothetical protein